MDKKKKKEGDIKKKGKKRGIKGWFTEKVSKYTKSSNPELKKPENNGRKKRVTNKRKSATTEKTLPPVSSNGINESEKKIPDKSKPKPKPKPPDPPIPDSDSNIKQSANRDAKKRRIERARAKARSKLPTRSVGMMLMGGVKMIGVMVAQMVIETTIVAAFEGNERRKAIFKEKKAEIASKQSEAFVSRERVQRLQNIEEQKEKQKEINNWKKNKERFIPQATNLYIDVEKWWYYPLLLKYGSFDNLTEDIKETLYNIIYLENNTRIKVTDLLNENDVIKNINDDYEIRTHKYLRTEYNDSGIIEKINIKQSSPIIKYKIANIHYEEEYKEEIEASLSDKEQNAYNNIKFLNFDIITSYAKSLINDVNNSWFSNNNVVSTFDTQYHDCRALYYNLTLRRKNKFINEQQTNIRRYSSFVNPQSEASFGTEEIGDNLLTGNFEGVGSTIGGSFDTFGAVAGTGIETTGSYLGISRVNQLDMKNVKLNNETNKKFRNIQNTEKLQVDISEIIEFYNISGKEVIYGTTIQENMKNGLKDIISESGPIGMAAVELLGSQAHKNGVFKIKPTDMKLINKTKKEVTFLLLEKIMEKTINSLKNTKPPIINNIEDEYYVTNIIEDEIILIINNPDANISELQTKLDYKETTEQESSFKSNFKEKSKYIEILKKEKNKLMKQEGFTDITELNTQITALEKNSKLQ